MGKDKPNISQHTNGIFKMLGLDPPFVKEVTITPNTLTATVYKRNADGKKYLVNTSPLLPSEADDEYDETGFSTASATETVTFEVRT